MMKCRLWLTWAQRSPGTMLKSRSKVILCSSSKISWRRDCRPTTFRLARWRPCPIFCGRPSAFSHTERLTVKHGGYHMRSQLRYWNLPWDDFESGRNSSSWGYGSLLAGQCSACHALVGSMVHSLVPRARHYFTGGFLEWRQPSTSAEPSEREHGIFSGISL